MARRIHAANTILIGLLAAWLMGCNDKGGQPADSLPEDSTQELASSDGLDGQDTAVAAVDSVAPDAESMDPPAAEDVDVSPIQDIGALDGDDSAVPEVADAADIPDVPDVPEVIGPDGVDSTGPEAAAGDGGASDTDAASSLPDAASCSAAGIAPVFTPTKPCVPGASCGPANEEGCLRHRCDDAGVCQLVKMTKGFPAFSTEYGSCGYFVCDGNGGHTLGAAQNTGKSCYAGYGACASGVCTEDGKCTVVSYAPKGTSCAYVDSPCRGRECDGAGGCVMAIHPGKTCGKSEDPCWSFTCNEDGECLPEAVTGTECPVVDSPCLQGVCGPGGKCVAVGNRPHGSECGTNCMPFAKCDGQGACKGNPSKAGVPCKSFQPCHSSEGTCAANGDCVAPISGGCGSAGGNNACAYLVCGADGACHPASDVGKTCQLSSDDITCMTKVCAPDGTCSATKAAVQGTNCGTATLKSTLGCAYGSCNGKGCCTVGSLQTAWSQNTLCGAKGYQCNGSGNCLPWNNYGQSCAGVCTGPGTWQLDGSCSAKLAPGKPCPGGPLQCGEPVCGPTGKCDGVVPTSGKSCFISPGLSGICNGANTCVPNPDVGKACQPAPCVVNPVWQADGTCKGQNIADGTPCSVGATDCVVSAACSGGQCVGVYDDSMCDDANQCSEDICCKPDIPECIGWYGSCKKHLGDGGTYCPSGKADCWGKGCVETFDTKLGEIFFCQTYATWMTCDDGNSCTTSDTCKGASGCFGIGQLDCDDFNLCTADSCDTAKGCQHQSVTELTPCGWQMACKAGVCSK